MIDKITLLEHGANPSSPDKADQEKGGIGGMSESDREKGGIRGDNFIFIDKLNQGEGDVGID
jgi:hypothetical protein